MRARGLQVGIGGLGFAALVAIVQQPLQKDDGVVQRWMC